MAVENEELELLDLDDDVELPELPSGNPLETSPRPKRPWLLFLVAALVIALSAYLIIRVVAHRPDDTVDVNLNPETTVTPPPAPTVVAPAPAPTPTPVQPVNIDASTGMPVRAVNDRPAAAFNPNAPTPVVAPKPRPAAPAPSPVKPATPAHAATAPAKPATPKPSVPVSSTVSTGYMVQVGSYSTKDAALAGQKHLASSHPSLFAGRPFVVLAAVLPNGTTTYRLRVTGFATSADANGFCNNAKSDGVDCYVAK
ncbi:MAG: SPOR domain-containing protein [Proteobacteria bacterium]|nr:SPOR domain-containing protein [Pseudomonadota bacterium]